MVPRLASSPRICHDRACAVRQAGTSLSYATSRRLSGLGRQEPPTAKFTPPDGHVRRQQSPASASRPRNSRNTWRADSSSDFEQNRHKRYQFWLNKKHTGRPFEPCQWLDSLNADRKDLPKPFAENPLAVLQDPDANVDLVKRCLGTFIAGTKRDLDSKAAVREHYKAAKVGSRALLWYIQGTFETVDISLDSRLGAILAHFLVGQDDMFANINQLLLTDHKPKFARNLSGSEQARWRGRLFRDTNEAVVYWAQTPHSGFNDALVLFHRTLESQDMRGLVPKAPAGDWLLNKLGTYDTDLVDVVLFEKLIHGCKVWMGKGSLRSRLSSAKLWLNHPQGPQPNAALELLRHVDLHREDFFETKDAPFDNTIAGLIVKTAQSLHKMDRLKEAEEVLDIFRRRLPDHFFGIARRRAFVLNHRAVMTMLLDGDDWFQARSERPTFDSARGKAILSNAVAIRRAAWGSWKPDSSLRRDC